MYVREFRDCRRHLPFLHIRFILVCGTLHQSVSVFFAKAQHNIISQIAGSEALDAIALLRAEPTINHRRDDNEDCLRSAREQWARRRRTLAAPECLQRGQFRDACCEQNRLRRRSWKWAARSPRSLAMG
jgi:hypothetical protein